MRDSPPGPQTRFTVNSEELEQVSAFKYLGCLLVCDDNGTQAMRGKFNKVCKCSARILHVLRGENDVLKVC